MRAANLGPSIEIEERSGRPGSYHHAPDYNPFRRVSPSRGRSGSIDLERPGTQRSTRHLVVPNMNGGQDRLSGSAFQHVESELAVGEAHMQEQDYGRNHGQRPEISQLDGRSTRRRRDEENPGKVLHDSIKDSNTLRAQNRFTGLARWACSFGFGFNHDIKVPLAAIGASSIMNGPLVKVARQESISVFRYWQGGCNPGDC